MEKAEMKCEMVAIGGSAGSMEVIFSILPYLHPNLAIPLIIVVHRNSTNHSLLHQLFSLKTTLPVKEVEDKESILPGTIYLAPPDYHLLIENNRTFSLDHSEKVNYSRPSIDVTFQTAAEAFGPSLACLLLSGASTDGVKGLSEVKKHGGIIVAQAPANAKVPYMPQHAISAMKIDHILKIDEMANFINNLAIPDRKD